MHIYYTSNFLENIAYDYETKNKPFEEKTLRRCQHTFCFLSNLRLVRPVLLILILKQIPLL